MKKLDAPAINSVTLKFDHIVLMLDICLISTQWNVCMFECLYQKGPDYLDNIKPLDRYLESLNCECFLNFDRLSNVIFTC